MKVHACCPIVLALCAGSAAAQTIQTLATLGGGGPGQGFGTSIDFVGDMNGDGFDEVAVGAPGDPTGGASAGAVTGFSGKDLSVLYFLPGGPDMRLGAAVAAAGDVDLDQVPDLIVGGTGSPSVFARIRVYRGSDGSMLYERLPILGNVTRWLRCGLMIIRRKSPASEGSIHLPAEGIRGRLTNPVCKFNNPQREACSGCWVC